MHIGVVKEIKDKENRVALTPVGVSDLVHDGHVIKVQAGAGEGSGFSDNDYANAGATICSVDTAWQTDLVVKVKEPLPVEYDYLGEQMVFTYFHLAGVRPDLTRVMLDKKTTALAYETLENRSGKLPLLAPMSAVAGNMSITIGSYYLARFNQGKGMQLGRVLGHTYGKVVIIGDGIVGRHAANIATGMGAEVHLGGRHPDRAAALRNEISPALHFFESRDQMIANLTRDADLVIGAVLLPGAKAPRVMTEEMVAAMQPGSVIVDVSIDQGGCIATSRPTSHSDPVYMTHGVIHYCVTNMPGAYPKTSTLALTNATLPYIRKLASKGLDALRDDPGFARAVNTYRGYITCKPVAEILKLPTIFREFSELYAMPAAAGR